MFNPDNVSIILKGIYYPGNIGSAARAMMNMGFKNMILVNPRCEPDQESLAMARSASFIYEKAPVYESLDQVAPEFQLLLGTSRRGAYRLHMRTSPRIMAREIVERYNNVKVGIVFGDEKAGLSNEDLEKCAWYVRIPSRPEFESLNVAQSVLVVCYELFTASLEEPDELLKESAKADTIFTLEAHLIQFLQAVGFPDRGSMDRVYTDIKRVISSADLKRTDVNLAHGFMRFLEEKFMGDRLPDDPLKKANEKSES